MTQQRYYTAHHDSQRADQGLEPIPPGIGPQSGSASREPAIHSCLTRQRTLPGFVQPGPSISDQASLRFLEPRRLRRLDVDGPSPMTLSINGRSIGVVRPGENTFDPPVALVTGDTLQLEALDSGDPIGSDLLTGWTSPAGRIDRNSSAGGGSHE